MCIYCGTNKYRKIYENHFGPIPKDSNGRTYEIHHINGDHSDNSPDNLRAVTIQEHYNIHYSQKDFGACFALANRLKISPEEKSFLSRQINQKKILERTHPFIGLSKKRVLDGTHHFLGGDISRRISNQRVKDKTHNFLGGEIQRDHNRRRVLNGTHHLLGGDIARKINKERILNGTHQNFKKWRCEHCGKEGQGPSYYRYHGDKCKLKIE